MASRARHADAVRRAPYIPSEREAIEELIGQGWLRDRRFVASCVVRIDEDPAVSVVDWVEVVGFARALQRRAPDSAARLWAVAVDSGRVPAERWDTRRDAC